MARGWESKSIVSQQEDAAGAKARGPELTAAERDTLQKRRSLELALAQSQAELIAEVFGTVVTLRYQNGRRAVSELVSVHGWNPEQGFLLESHLPAPQAGPNQGDES